MNKLSTQTDTQFAARFSDLSAETFVANQAALGSWTPTSSVLNTGMMSDIGRATIYNPDIQDSFYARFMKAPLGRGDSVMSMRVGETTSYAYSPEAEDSVLFGDYNPAMSSNVATKNLSRQVAVAINDYYLKQMAQTEEMIGEAESAIMAVSNACYRDDMWVASKEYFSGSTNSAKSGQLYTMTNDVDDSGFADEMVEALWSFSQNKFGYKSALYNPSGFNTKSSSVHIALKKGVEFPAFKKLYSETFNPEFIRISQTIDYVDDFATPAGAPVGAGELIGMIVDDRAFSITPMPDTLTTESFRNPARKETIYFTTYEYAFQKDPFFNIGYIFAPDDTVRYTATFVDAESQGSTVIGTVTVEAGEAVVFTTTPSHEGLTFAGWDPTFVSGTTVITEDTTFTATYEV